jgi:hypothetical protein
MLRPRGSEEIFLWLAVASGALLILMARALDEAYLAEWMARQRAREAVRMADICLDLAREAIAHQPPPEEKTPPETTGGGS